ncbi:MAG TPA: cation transporter [Gemmatimonadaceae bacterium]|nr:cation transporter [Gemmatimonadaceae bacterium]
MDTTISISGMTCGHCVTAVRKALQSVPGVTIQDVKVGSAAVEFDSPATLASAEAAITDAGYDVVKGRTLNVTSAQPEA